MSHHTPSINLSITPHESEVIQQALEAFAANLYSDKSTATRAIEFVQANGGTPAEVAEKERGLETLTLNMATAHGLIAKLSE